MKKILPYLMLLMLMAPAGEAATAYRYQDSVTTIRGDVVGGAYVTVYVANTSTKATLYLDRNTTTNPTQKANPTLTDGYGRYFFYVTPGIYDITISGANVVTYTLEDVTIASDIGYVYNVTDYGASPDSTNDDTASIIAAIVAAGTAGGGQVLLPPGRYGLSATKAKDETSAYGAIFVEYDDISIIGSGVGATILEPVTGEDGFTAIVFDLVTRCSVTGVSFQNFTDVGDGESYGIKSYGGSHISITNCSFDNCDNAGASLGYDYTAFYAQSDSMRAVPNDTIDGSFHVFSNNTVTNTPEGHGVEIARSNNCLVSNNIIKNTSLYGIRVGGTYGTAVIGNLIYDCASGITFLAAGDTDIGVTKHARGCSAVGNVVSGDLGMSVRSGVFDCSISNNVFSVLADSVGVGIEIPHTTDDLNGDSAVGNIQVHDNTVYGGAVSILLTAEGYGVDIKDNSCTDFDWMGVYVSAAASSDTISSVNIEGNIISPGLRDPSHTDKYGVKMDGALLSGRECGTIYDLGGYAGSWYETANTSAISICTLQAVQAAAAPDTAGRRGLMWFDKTNSKMKVYDGTAWRDLH